MLPALTEAKARTAGAMVGKSLVLLRGAAAALLVAATRKLFSNVALMIPSPLLALVMDTPTGTALYAVCTLRRTGQRQQQQINNQQPQGSGSWEQPMTT